MQNLMRFSVLVALMFTAYSLNAQQLVKFQFDQFQEAGVASGPQTSLLNFPDKSFVLEIQDLNSLAHMGNTLNVYGDLLLIDSWSYGSNGKIRLTLRREDGQNFFNLFPTVTATIEPLITSDSEIKVVSSIQSEKQ